MKRYWIFGLLGFAATTLLGTVLHFLYGWLSGGVWIAPFGAVNESTFEHMKLLFWPMLIYGIFQSLFFKEERNFPCVKLRGILLGLSLIPILFYTYNGAIGKSPDLINILVFFVSAAAAYIYETVLFTESRPKCSRPRIAWLMIAIIALCFILFTFRTPKLAIFRDPVTGKYGI